MYKYIYTTYKPKIITMSLIIKSSNESTAYLVGDSSEILYLSKQLEFQPDGYRFMTGFIYGYWDGYIRPINAKTGEFNKGLVSTILKTAKSHNIQCEMCPIDFKYLSDIISICNIDNISNGDSVSIEPYDFQINGVNHILKNKRCIIESPTGSGKSLMQYITVKSMLDSHKYNKVLIIVPTVSLVTQLYGDFLDYSENDDTFNAENICHTIAEGSPKKADKPLYISTWQSLQHIKDKKYFEEFDVIMVDECHTASAKSITNIMEYAINATIKVGFSGTLKDCKMDKTALFGLFGDVYKTATTKELMDRGILATLIVKNIQLKHRESIPPMEYKEEINYLVSHEKRNNFIIKLAASLEGNTLILFELVQKHGKVLYADIKEKYPDKDIYLIYGGIKSGKREEIRKLLETKENAIIIASYQTFQAGINIKKLHNIIFASPSKSKIRVFQSVGRGLRTHSTKNEAVLYDISDDLSGTRKLQNHTLRHFESRLEMYNAEEFNIKSIKLTI